MPYRSEEREKFFNEDFPAIRILTALAADVPAGNICDALGRQVGDEVVRKLVACVCTMTTIIDDDQAEIASLKAIIKGKA